MATLKQFKTYIIRNRGVILNWSKSDVNSIKLELLTRHYDSVKRLSDRLGVDEASVRNKVGGIKLKEEIRKLAKGTGKGLKKHRGRRFRKYGSKIKRKVRSNTE